MNDENRILTTEYWLLTTTHDFRKYSISSEPFSILRPDFAAFASLNGALRTPYPSTALRTGPSSLHYAAAGRWLLNLSRRFLYAIVIYLCMDS